MTIARNGDVELYYESIGPPKDPTLVLVNGFTSQCINFALEWCQLFVDEGYRVIRFDNRDVGLSSKLDGVDYSLDATSSSSRAVVATPPT